jgi:hypothetical protein
MLPTVDDPSVTAIVRAVVSEVVGEIKADFGPRHDLITQYFDTFERRIDEMEHRLEEIQRGATFTQMLAQDTWAQTHQGAPMPQPPRPLPHAPRPKTIDDACAVPPGEAARVVRLPRYGATVVPEPGTDPEVVWPNFIRSVNTPEGSAREAAGSRRPRRR